MADERVATVVDRQGASSVPTEDTARGEKPTPQDVAVERVSERGALERTEQF